MNILLFLTSLLVASSTAAIADENCDSDHSLCGRLYSESVTCDEVNVALQANMRSIETPTLFLNDTEIKLEDGPDYTGPFCFKYRGKFVAGFTEYMGNAYETYRIIDLDTFEVTEVSYAKAKKIGFDLW